MSVNQQIYQAYKLLTASQYGRIISGAIKIPKGVTLVNATTADGGAHFTVMFQGQGLGSNFLFQAIACSMSVSPTTGILEFAASGVYHQPPSF